LVGDMNPPPLPGKKKGFFNPRGPPPPSTNAQLPLSPGNQTLADFFLSWLRFYERPRPSHTSFSPPPPRTFQSIPNARPSRFWFLPFPRPPFSRFLAFSRGDGPELPFFHNTGAQSREHWRSSFSNRPTLPPCCAGLFLFSHWGSLVSSFWFAK